MYSKLHSSYHVGIRGIDKVCRRYDTVRDRTRFRVNSGIEPGSPYQLTAIELVGSVFVEEIPVIAFSNLTGCISCRTGKLSRGCAVGSH